MNIEPCSLCGNKLEAKGGFNCGLCLRCNMKINIPTIFNHIVSYVLKPEWLRSNKKENKK